MVFSLVLSALLRLMTAHSVSASADTTERAAGVCV